MNDLKMLFLFKYIICFLFILSISAVANASEWDRALKSHNEGRDYYISGDYKKALEQYEKALVIYRKLDSKQSISSALSDIGRVYYSLGKYDDALKFFNRSLLIDKKYNIESNISLHLNDISEVYISRGRYDEALKHLNEALRIEKKSNRKTQIAVYLNNIGKVYYSWGRYDEALKNYNEALNIEKKLDRKTQIAVYLNNIGKVYYSQGRYDEALKNYNEALNIETELERKAQIAESLSNIGNAYYALGKKKEALENLVEALNIEKRLKREAQIADCLDSIGVVYFSQNRYVEAIKYYFEALAIDKKLEREGAIAKHLSNIGSSYYKIKDYSSAIKYLKESVEIYEKIRKTAKGDVRRDYLEKVIGAYKWLSTAYISNGEAKEAYKTIELSRAKLLAERLTGSDDKVRTPSYNDDKKVIAKDEALIIYANSDWQEMVLIVMTDNSIKGLKVPSESFIKSAMEKYGEAVNIMNENQRGIKLSKKTKDDLKAAVSGEKVDIDDFKDLISYYRTLLTNPDPENNKNVKELGRILYDYLVKPVNGIVGDKKRLVIVPEGVLGLLPFETLVDENGHYLAMKYNITYTQSVEILRLLRNREYEDSRKPFLALGGAIYDETSYDVDMIENEAQLAYLEKSVYTAFKKRGSVRDAYAALGFGNWKNLPGTLNEVNAISKKINNTVLLTGNDVKEEIIKSMSTSGLLSEYRVIHFATHGLVVSALPELSALVLSQFIRERKEDGYLRMGEIAELELKADFVNLSTCETGLGKVYGGEGIVGLTQSFLIAGANGVSVSLWQVNDKSTAEFMVAMYEIVNSEGVEYTDAIAKIKRKFIRGDFGVEYTSPFYWAPFVYYGR